LNEREIVELALGTQDVKAITPDVIAKTIDEVSRHKRVFSQLFRENRDLVGKPGRRLIIPRFVSNIAVSSEVGEGTSISPSTFSYEGTTIDVVKFGIRFEIDKEAIETPVRDILKDALAISGREWANELDKRAMTIALDLKTGTITSWSGGTLGAATAPVVQIISVNGATIDSVDYYKGSVVLTGSVSAATVTYLYSNRCKSTGLYIDVNTAEYLKIWDVLKLRSTLVANSIYPDVLIVHPREVETLLYDPDCMSLFVSIREYSDKQEILNGEIGQIADLKVLASGQVPEGIGILVDSNRLGYDVIKRDLTGTKEDKPEYDQVWYHLWSEREFGVSDTLAIGIAVNAKTGKYKAAHL